MTSDPIPVFNCIVYVHADESGGMRARVANLAGIECTGANEREALSKVVATFKQAISDLMQGESAIPWIEPPAAKEPGEQERFIPVHL